MPRAGLQILLESMSLVQCRKSNICLKRPGRILGRRKTPIPRVMVAKPPLQIRGRSDITLLRIVYRSKNVCVEHSIIIPQKPSAALLRVSLETATEGILRSLLPSRPLFEDGVPSVADLLRKSRRTRMILFLPTTSIQISFIRPPTRFLGNGYGGHPSFSTAGTPPLRGWRAIRSRFASQIAKDGRGERI